MLCALPLKINEQAATFHIMRLALKSNPRMPRFMPLTLGKARPRQRLLSGPMLLWPHYLLKRYGQWRDFATRYQSASSDSLTTFLPGYNLKPNTLNICVNFLSSCASSIGRRCGWSGAVASLLLLLTWTNPHAM